MEVSDKLCERAGRRLLSAKPGPRSDTPGDGFHS